MSNGENDRRIVYGNSIFLTKEYAIRKRRMKIAWTIWIIAVLIVIHMNAC